MKKIRQRPLIKVPLGGASYAFGIIKTDEDKKLIPLALVKPLILRPSIQNEEIGDELELGNLAREGLREANYSVVRGNIGAGFVFVDAEEMPDAIRPFGRYTIEGETIKMRVSLFKNKLRVATVTVEGNKTDLAGLTKKIVETIEIGARKLSGN